MVPHPLHRISTEARAFTELRPPSATSSARFFSGGGNRFDYWRIAWHEFRSHPWKGVGAGSYDTDYFRMRRTTEDVTQPHSIELQGLAELGVVGGIGVLGLAGAVLFGLGRRFRRSRRSSAEAGLAVAAGGVFLTWLVHTSRASTAPLTASLGQPKGGPAKRFCRSAPFVPPGLIAASTSLHTGFVVGSPWWPIATRRMPVRTCRGTPWPR